ncbi:hypothetical protein SAMN05421786_104338 [Chryseobacterium ureilyticum]|uniref:Uncharacterized protein n=1 Tax=Chryseobacterium ureilyticum TaxID=373668 RepID=A0A1N7P386_9FLAO|nr:hypothetical protein SAMN05421786_104338 [Chryseobacterium ureilyticum]
MIINIPHFKMMTKIEIIHVFTSISYQKSGPQPALYMFL